MNSWLQVVVFLFVVVTALTIGLIIAGDLSDFDDDKICTSAHGERWTHVDGPDDRGVYCKAPNGTVHLTIIHLTGPSWSFVAAPIIAGVLAVLIGVLRYVQPSQNEGETES